jgi:uncharacterized protein (DUF849 family)
MLVQACLNGGRLGGYHPRLPLTPEALAADARACILAGAAELHLHVRGEDGAESLAPAAVDATVAAVRDAVPGTFVGISTGEWIERDDDRRLAMIEAWRKLPDHASVNLSEPGAPAVIERLRRRGIAVEAGLATSGDAERLLRLGLAPLALRILIELDGQDPGEAMAATDAILESLAAGDCRKPILLHGFDATVWQFIGRCAREGYATRIGLEDGKLLPDGRLAGSNAELVAAAVAMMRSAS